MYTHTLMTSIGTCGPTRAARPFLKMPAFLDAISGTVFPKTRVWSSAAYIYKVCV